MPNNWNTPTTTDTYTNILSIIRAELASALKMDLTGDSNIPTGAVIADSAVSYKLKRWNGASYDLLPFHTTIDNHIADTTIHYTPPPGVIWAHGGGSAPTGFLMCDGAAVSRTTYAALFAIIGTTYGAGDGSTTFNLPDLRGRFPLGKAASGTGNTLGGTGGALDHTHTGPSHTHTVAGHTHDMGNHTHTSASHSHTIAAHSHSVGAHYHDCQGSGATIQVTSSGAHNHDARGKEGGSNGSGADRPQGASSTTGTNVTWSNGVPTAQSNHAHPHANVTGTVGNVGSGNNGDSGFNTGTQGLTTDATVPGATGAPSTNTTSSTPLTSDAGGTAATGANNPAYLVINYIIKT